MIGVDVEPDGEEAPGQVQHIIIQVCSLAQSFDHFLALIIMKMSENDVWYLRLGKESEV